MGHFVARRHTLDGDEHCGEVEDHKDVVQDLQRGRRKHVARCTVSWQARPELIAAIRSGDWPVLWLGRLHLVVVAVVARDGRPGRQQPEERNVLGRGPGHEPDHSKHLRPHDIEGGGVREPRSFRSRGSGSEAEEEYMQRRAMRGGGGRLAWQKRELQAGRRSGGRRGRLCHQLLTPKPK